MQAQKSVFWYKFPNFIHFQFWLFYFVDDKDKECESDKKDKKDDGKEGGARNLWVSGLSGDTRAKDLKQLCSKHGKVKKSYIISVKNH